MKTTTKGVLWLFSFLAGLVELISESEAAIAFFGLIESVFTALGTGQEPPASPMSPGNLSACEL